MALGPSLLQRARGAWRGLARAVRTSAHGQEPRHVLLSPFNVTEDHRPPQVCSARSQEGRTHRAPRLRQVNVCHSVTWDHSSRSQFALLVLALMSKLPEFCPDTVVHGVCGQGNDGV